ncbi:ABC transporter ATP-binding protein [Leifsonia aquatica]|uniref:ABC transporter, ATP-binding protein n=2 Tax=Leifsonia aquatica TaxID=144185 RepID=U2SZX2_LEIAQ|nr:ABC transporter ATP-binding protein [Leifsonia aquatica]ERK70803.1 ABC transporter, ATP-binding protein [Leifsonia aquatica ATCC 14665]MBB2967000.1 ABC-2 type transport system ATP-binding protein [Leifsonia aquatica]
MMNYSPGTETPADAAVVMDGLRVKRGRALVLDGLSISVPRGQVVGLLGPSGCGKTTLMRSIVGVQRVAGGTVTVLGQPAGTAALRHRVGYVTQAASVYDDLTVTQNLQYFRRVLGAGADDVASAIAATDLGANAAQLVSTLSGGQRSRVSLAAALLGSPDVLVLDEPTVGLDPLLRADLWDLFHRLAEGGTSLLISSHVMDEATRCDRLLLMREGAVIADSTPDELLAETGAVDAEGAFLALLRRRHPRHQLPDGDER